MQQEQAVPITLNIKSELKVITHLAWPAILGMLGGQVMNIVDMLMLGRLGEDAIAIAGMGFLWSMPMIMFMIGCIRGMDPIVSQAHGAKTHSIATLAYARGFVIAGILLLPAMGWHLLAPWTLKILNQPLHLIPEASQYCFALMWGIPGSLVFHVQRAYLQGITLMRPPAVVMLGANLFNVPLNWLLMYGWPGFEGFGVIGCAWATALCQTIVPLWLWLRSRHQLPKAWLKESGICNLKGLRKQMALGIPIAMQICLEAWAFNVAGLLVGTLGANELAAHMIALNLATTAWMFAMGLSAAATTRIGNLLGAAKPWHVASWTAITLAVALMTLSAILFIFYPGLLANLYTHESDIVGLALILIPIAGAFQIVDGIQSVAGGVLRGLADVRIPAIALIVAHWLIGLPLGAYLAHTTNLGVQGIWWGLVAGLTLTAAFFCIRILQLTKTGVKTV
ncbi:MAG: hypothetical protein CMH60_06065 [Myxococcales bacterium]|nr:hypothetical protein [Myxococcales bacterium]